MSLPDASPYRVRSQRVAKAPRIGFGSDRIQHYSTKSRRVLVSAQVLAKHTSYNRSNMKTSDSGRPRNFGVEFGFQFPTTQSTRANHENANQGMSRDPCASRLWEIGLCIE